MIPPWYCHKCNSAHHEEWMKDQKPDSTVSIHHNARMKVIQAATSVLSVGKLTTAVEKELREAISEYRRLNKFFDGQYCDNTKNAKVR